MARCISEFCRHKIDPRWAFCPQCGTDNRPPKLREEVQPHADEYIDGARFCIVCGSPNDESPLFPRRSRVRLGTAFLVSGLTVGLIVLYIRLAYSVRTLPLADWIVSWYYTPALHQGRRRGFWFKYISPLGEDIVIWGGGLAVVLVCVALALYSRVPSRVPKGSESESLVRPAEPRDLF